MNGAGLVDWSHTTCRRRFSIDHRATASVDVFDRRMFDQLGRAMRLTGTGLADVLGSVGDHQSVVVCDGDSAQLVRGWAAAPAPAGWEQVRAFADDRSPSLDVRHPESGRRVRLSTGQQWTGTTVGGERTGEVLRRLRGAIEDAWGREGGTLLATPATTGRHLLALALPESLGEWPVLSAEVAELIRSTSGQHRLELVAPAGREVPALVELDARLAYAGVTWGLPVGEPTWRKGEPVEWRGRWRGRCRWEVAEDWTGPGLVPVQTDDGWRWPSLPGESGVSWLDGAEADLARRYGWRVTVLECIEWPKGPDPCRTWTDRLTAIYRDTLEAETRAEVSRETAGAMRAGVRAILLHGIGAMHGRPQLITHVARGREVADIPESAVDLSMADDGESVVWTERRPAAWPEMVRPEWTSTIWARNRCRLLDAPGARVRGKASARVGALHLPPSVELLGFRGDALYVTADPRWPDDGMPGRFRAKGEGLGAHRVPATLPELDELRRASSTATGPALARAALAEVRARQGEG